VDARTASSGSSVWEGQLQSLVLSEYASTEMSLHALYMHQVCGPLKNRIEGFRCKEARLGFQSLSAPYLLCSLHSYIYTYVSPLIASSAEYTLQGLHMVTVSPA
jgi:hypothetical protein